MYKIIKNLTIIDYEALYRKSIDETWSFCSATGNHLNQSDIARLFRYCIFNNFLQIYEEYKKNQSISLVLVVNNLNDKYKGNLPEFKRIFNLLKNKFNVPTVDTSFTVEEFCLLVSGNSPEYDELAMTKFNLIFDFNKLLRYFQQNGFIALTKKYENLQGILKLLITK